MTFDTLSAFIASDQFLALYTGLVMVVFGIAWWKIIKTP